jgi:outer membrane lipoprotein LolB
LKPSRLARALLSSGAILFIGVLTGCATPLGTALPPYPAKPILGFEANGRLAVNYSQGAFTGAIRWQHDADHDDLLLLSPTGQGVARIVRDTQGAKLTTADGKTYTAGDVESLTQSILGWTLPLGKLAYWIVAEPVPHEPLQVEQGDDALPRRLTQQPWDSLYQAYRKVAGLDVPEKLVLKGPGMDIKLVIQSWRLALDRPVYGEQLNLDSIAPAPLVPAPRQP